MQFGSFSSLNFYKVQCSPSPQHEIIYFLWGDLKVIGFLRVCVILRHEFKKYNYLIYNKTYNHEYKIHFMNDEESDRISHAMLFFPSQSCAASWKDGVQFLLEKKRK